MHTITARRKIERVNWMQLFPSCGYYVIKCLSATECAVDTQHAPTHIQINGCALWWTNEGQRLRLILEWPILISIPVQLAFPARINELLWVSQNVCTHKIVRQHCDRVESQVYEFVKDFNAKIAQATKCANDRYTIILTTSRCVVVLAAHTWILATHTNCNETLACPSVTGEWDSDGHTHSPTLWISLNS